MSQETFRFLFLQPWLVLKDDLSDASVILLDAAPFHTRNLRIFNTYAIHATKGQPRTWQTTPTYQTALAKANDVPGSFPGDVTVMTNQGNQNTPQHDTPKQGGQQNQGTNMPNKQNPGTGTVKSGSGSQSGSGNR